MVNRCVVACLIHASASKRTSVFLRTQFGNGVVVVPIVSRTVKIVPFNTTRVIGYLLERGIRATSIYTHRLNVIRSNFVVWDYVVNETWVFKRASQLIGASENFRIRNYLFHYLAAFNDGGSCAVYAASAVDNDNKDVFRSDRYFGFVQYRMARIAFSSVSGSGNALIAMDYLAASGRFALVRAQFAAHVLICGRPQRASNGHVISVNDEALHRVFYHSNDGEASRHFFALFNVACRGRFLRNFHVFL